MTKPMSSYLMIRCSECPNRTFRSIDVAEEHMLRCHKMPCGTGFTVEWVVLPTGSFGKGGYRLGAQRTVRHSEILSKGCR